MAVAISVGRHAEAAKHIPLMLAIVARPINAEVIEQGGFLAKLRTDDALHQTQPLHFFQGRTALGHEVLLIATVEQVSKAVADGPVRIDLVAGIDIELELRLLLVVFVLAFAIGQNPIGIGQTFKSKLLGKEEGVVGSGIVQTSQNFVGMLQTETVVAHITNIVGIGVNKRSLNQAEDIGGRDILSGIAFCPTIVAQVVGVAHITHIQTGGESFKKFHIGIEADVEAVEVIVFGGCFTLSVTQRKVVHRHLVTSLHAHAIVLREGRSVKVFLPIGIVMVLLVEKVIFVLVEERNGHRRGQQVGILRCAQELGQIVAILIGIHHRELRGNLLYPTISTDIDARCHRLASLGGDAQNTIGTFRTIEGGTIAEHLYGFNIFGVNQIEYIVDETIVNGGTIILHVPNHAIDNYQGLCIGIERIDTIEQHHRPLSELSATIDGAQRGIECVFEISLNGDGAGCFGG